MTEIDVARTSSAAPLHVWGWEIPVYLFLGGMAAGAMILSSLLLLRRGERSPAARWLALAAPALVSVGMGALFLDLARKAHVWRFYLAFRAASPMSWGAWILLAVYPVSLAFGLASLADDQAARARAVAARVGLGRAFDALRALGAGRERPLAWAHLATGVALGVYTGILLSTLAARPLWNSALLGPLFLVSGLSTGAALFLLFPLREEERRAAARWDLVAIGIEGALLALFLLGLATSGQDGRAAAALLLGGPFTAPFWTLVVIAGLAVPALLEGLEARFHLRATAAAPALVILGGLALRWILVAAGQV